MAQANKPSILIIGAGAIGVMLGYHLSLAGADLTFLVRSHHAARLSRTQILYSYSAKTLEELKDFNFITDPAQISNSKYDYVLVTPDAPTMMTPAGVDVVKAIGEASKASDAKVLLAGTYHNFKSWFAQTSGVPESRISTVIVPIAIHETHAKLKTHGDVDVEKFNSADYAYVRLDPDVTIRVDDEPAFANFISLYNASGVGSGTTWSAETLAVQMLPVYALFISLELLGWPALKDLDRESEPWVLGIAAVKELRGLSIHGDAGREAAAATTEESFFGMFSALEQAALPLDIQDFNRHHHGGKVSKQNRDSVKGYIKVAEAEGEPLTAAPKLIQLLEETLASSA